MICGSHIHGISSKLEQKLRRRCRPELMNRSLRAINIRECHLRQCFHDEDSSTCRSICSSDIPFFWSFLAIWLSLYFSWNFAASSTAYVYLSLRRHGAQATIRRGHTEQSTNSVSVRTNIYNRLSYVLVVVFSRNHICLYYFCLFFSLRLCCTNL